MAKGFKTGGRNIKKGQVLNPNGRPRVPEYVKSARKLTQVKFAEVLYKYINATFEDLKEVIENPKTPSLDLIVVKVLTEAIKHGDEKRLNFILERMIGKVKEVREHHHRGISTAVNLKKLDDDQLRQLAEIVKKGEIVES